MIREIKFRGKSIVTGKWVYGDLLTPSNAEQDYHIQPKDGFVAIPVYKESIGQFTGLHDKDGKEIYGGDIVDISGNKGPKPSQFVMLISWDNDNASYCFVYDTGEPMRNINRKDRERMKIIGNIYENPELLTSNK